MQRITTHTLACQLLARSKTKIGIKGNKRYWKNRTTHFALQQNFTHSLAYLRIAVPATIQIVRVAMHHKNSLRNAKALAGKKPIYEQIRSNLTRNQVPLCHKRHNDHTHGRLRLPEKLRNIYLHFTIEF